MSETSILRSNMTKSNKDRILGAREKERRIFLFIYWRGFAEWKDIIKKFPEIPTTTIKDRVYALEKKGIIKKFLLDRSGLRGRPRVAWKELRRIP